MSLIKNEFTSICKKAFKRYGEQFNVDPSNVQIVMHLDSEQSDAYLVMHSMDPKTAQRVSFKDILGIKIDFLGKTVFVPAFIKKTLLEQAAEHNISPQLISALCYTNGQSIDCYLYDGSKPVKSLMGGAIFSDDKLLTE